MGGGISSVLCNKADESSPLHFDSYHLGDCVGYGSFASVRIARHQSYSKQLIIKQLKLEAKSMEKTVNLFLAELSALKMVGHHPNLPYLHVAFVHGNSCFMGLDYISGGDLRYHIVQNAHFTIEHIAFIIGSIGSALNHIHQLGIIHRDIKPENIVLTEFGDPVLVDFGVAYIEYADSVPLCTAASGTLQYLAPEIFTPKRRHSVHVDFWSLGLVMYEMLYGDRPFNTHCWKSLIYFSENHHKRMWDRLEGMRFGGMNALLVDWSALASGTEEERLGMLSFPDHDVPLEADGSLPPTMQVPVPAATKYGETISTDCGDLLAGLLDVRIPHRLCSGKSYHRFAMHPLFLSFGYNFSTPCEQRAPFIPDTELVAAYLQGKFAHHNMLCSLDISLTDDALKVQLSDTIKKKLESIEFLSPQLLKYHNAMTRARV